MGAHGYDGLAFTGSDWFEWLSGYALKDQPFERPYVLIITADLRSFAVVSDLARYGMAMQARCGELWLDSVMHYSESSDSSRHKYLATQWQDMLLQTLRSAGLTQGRIGVEGSGELLARATAELPGLRIERASKDLRNVRRMKHPEEITTMRRCAALADWTIGAYREELRLGRLLAEIDAAVCARLTVEAAKRHTSERFAIVALRTLAGPTSICADGFRAHDQVLQAGDRIVNTNIAMRLNGLAMELARPWLVGTADRQIVSLFDCVHEAQQQSMAAAVAGQPISGIHSAAQKVFERAGYAEQFFLRAGHGIGVVQHDFPVDVPFDDRALLERETYAIEPALNIENVGDFRFADTIAVTASGSDPLTRAPRNRTELTLS
jgi:Xaa-Pro aminopeptidase